MIETSWVGGTKAEVIDLEPDHQSLGLDTMTPLRDERPRKFYLRFHQELRMFSTVTSLGAFLIMFPSKDDPNNASRPTARGG